MTNFKPGDRVYDIDNPNDPSYRATVLSDNGDNTVWVRFDKGFGSHGDGVLWPKMFLAHLNKPTYRVVEVVAPPETLDLTPERLAEILSGSEWTLTNSETGQSFKVEVTR